MRPTNDPWVWIDPSVVHAVHDEQLGEHGGSAGLRAPGLLELALARPIQLAAYGDADAASLAAAYGFGLAKNHPFIDGNKRTSFVAVELLLTLNGWELCASDADAVIAMLNLAASDWSEAQFADWVRANSTRV